MTSQVEHRRLTPAKTVQRLALSALNSAARNKPELIRDHLGRLLPQVYDETTMKAELVEVVQMGPWQHKVDKGLESRKAAYETMYTLVSLHVPVVAQLTSSSVGYLLIPH